MAQILTIPCRMMACYTSHTVRSLARNCSIVIAAALTVGLTPVIVEPDLETRPLYSKRVISRAIHVHAKRNRLNPALLRAVIKVESGFKQDAVSPKGAVGLMQLTPATAATLPVVDLRDPIQNIRGGAKHLRRLLNRYDNSLPLALAAYNAGVNRVKNRKVPRIRETRTFVRKVLRYYNQYQTDSPRPRSKKPRRPVAHRARHKSTQSLQLHVK